MTVDRRDWITFMRSTNFMRTRFSVTQIEALKACFVRNAYPTKSTRVQMADKLNLSEAQVRTWFQNRRCGLKKFKELPSRVRLTKSVVRASAEKYISTLKFKKTAVNNGLKWREIEMANTKSFDEYAMSKDDDVQVVSVKPSITPICSDIIRPSGIFMGPRLPLVLAQTLYPYCYPRGMSATTAPIGPGLNGPQLEHFWNGPFWHRPAQPTGF